MARKNKPKREQKKPKKRQVPKERDAARGDYEKR